jgi:hypothetical protein
VGISNVSSNLRPGICTSTTRPTTPYEGQVIYETDTNRTLVWDNAAWVDPSTGKSERSGIVKITPTGATNGTVSTNGDVTIGSGVSTTTVSGVFSSVFDNYLIVVSGGSNSLNSRIGLQLGSTNSGYKSSLIYNSWNTTLGIVSTNTASNFQYAFNGASGGIYGEVYLSSPNLAKWTSMRGYWANTSDTGLHTGVLENTTSYTNFTLVPLTGTMTGATIRVYGYNQ